MIRLNGEERPELQGRMLADALKNEGYRLDVIAVQIDGDIVSKKDYGSFCIADGNTIEVVAFVGGGCR